MHGNALLRTLQMYIDNTGATKRIETCGLMANTSLTDEEAYTIYHAQISHFQILANTNKQQSQLPKGLARTISMEIP